MHAGAQVARVPLGDRGDEIGRAGQRERRGEAADRRRDLAREAERAQRLVDRSPVRAPPRDEDVPGGRVADGRDPAARERVPLAHDADEPVAKERLHVQLGTGRLADDAGLQVDGSLAQRRVVLLELGHEAQPDPRRFPADASEQARPEILDETVARPQRERPGHLAKVRLARRAQDRLRVLHERPDGLSELDRPRRGHEAAPGPDQQRILRRLAQPRQRPAHRRGAQAQAPGRARDAPLGEQHVERHEQVEVGRRHAATFARP